MAQVDSATFVRCVSRTHKLIADGKLAAELGADTVATELGLKNSSQVNTRIQSLTKQGLEGVPQFKGKKRGRSLNINELNNIAAEYAVENESADAA